MLCLFGCLILFLEGYLAVWRLVGWFCLFVFAGFDTDLF